MLHAADSLDLLRGRLAGDLVTADDPDWDRARRAWNLAADQHPAAVAFPETADDVVAVVRFAAAHGLRVAAQGTGHNASAMGPLTGTVLVRTERMRGVSIDPVARLARVEAGALWQDVTVPAAAHGLAALAGSSADVGVVGYTLGGGMSWLGRRYGLAANHVTAVEVVTADGRRLRADADHHADLFWALRGGGGSFAVVTAIEFRLFPHRDVFAGALFFPLERAGEVLRAWRRWTDTVPETVTSVGRTLVFPPLPEVPAPLRGGAFAIVEVIALADEDRGARLVAPLRALGAVIDTFAQISLPALQQLHMDPEEPVAYVSVTAQLRELPDAAVDALLATAFTADRQLPMVEIRHLGGAFAVAPPGAGAVGSFPAPFQVFAGDMVTDTAAVPAQREHLEALVAAVAPWDSGTRYLNFVEDPVPTTTFFDAETYARLRGVKTRYDAGDRIMANHPIPPIPLSLH